jgi:hypothetical protein
VISGFGSACFGFAQPPEVRNWDFCSAGFGSSQPPEVGNRYFGSAGFDSAQPLEVGKKEKIKKKCFVPLSCGEGVVRLNGNVKKK